GRFDPQMYRTVASLGVPYILMHISGTPQTMQQSPHYEDVVNEVLDFFILELEKLRTAGIKDIVLDPGFGFGKTVEHNYQLLKNLHVFEAVTGLPVLAGISRKSMICKVLKLKPEHALNGTTALHMVALREGARILRVHDVKEAAEVIRLWETMETA
ncbi:MAG: dihydropteroate synthase, partial [Saprospiraceae bacterium]|nr:dihydropteroate synthase [Saprospiraceae bacterium]